MASSEIWGFHPFSLSVTDFLAALAYGHSAEGAVVFILRPGYLSVTYNGTTAQADHRRAHFFESPLRCAQS